MIFVKNAKDLRFVRFNKAGEELLGYSRENLIGKNDYDFFPKAEADMFTSQDREVLLRGSVLDLPENSITTRYHGIRVLRSKKVPIYDVNGNPQYLLGISEDITEEKHAEEVRIKWKQEQMARAEAEKNVTLRDDFIAMISHELKTPLTSLRMQLQMLPKLFQEVTFPGKEKFFELFHRSLRQLNQFSNLVEQLLDLSRVSTGRLVLDIRRLFLADVILRVVEQYGPDLKSAGCDVKLNLDSTVEGNWDPIRIEQVIVNLLSNAMKYGQGKPIEITTKVDGERAILMVRDQGIGISKEDQTKLFERFVRAAPITSYRGLGLGLFIIRQIIQAHGGRIWIESESGKGSIFFVEIPRDPIIKVHGNDSCN
jgi:PAS domain S-box-containing protein